MILSQKYSAAGDFAQKSKGGEGNCTGSRKEESGRRLMCECCVNVVRVLCECCASVVQVLCECCASIVRVLCECCASVVRVLCECCASGVRVVLSVSGM